jgi:hypothetical protein
VEDRGELWGRCDIGASCEVTGREVRVVGQVGDMCGFEGRWEIGASCGVGGG